VASRLRMLGLDVAPVLPLHFVVQGELQRALPGILLRRTADLPPADDVGVIPAAALLAYCRRATTIDAIAVGDWLLERHHLDSDVLVSLVAGRPWRDGAAEAAWVLEHLVDGSRSLPESKARVMIGFAGLPTPEPNAPEVLGDVVVHADLWFPAYRCAGEYEAEQHHRERARYVADIDRYALYRRHDVHLVQLTKEVLGGPRTLVCRVHEALVHRGYDGPAPDFGPGWDRLVARLSHVVPRKRRPLRLDSHRFRR
jgi:hypothetical protein